MRIIVSLLLAGFSLFSATEVSAQQRAVVKKGVANKNNNSKKSTAEQTIEELNRRLNAVDDEIDKKTLKPEVTDEMAYVTEQLINVANDYKGTKYRWGGMSRKGMDCSGFVKTAFDQFGINLPNLPRTSREMATLGKKVSKSEAKPGDLIFFKNGGSRVINHVGIVVEANNGIIKFIHSSSSRGVVISSMSEAYYKKGFAQINRVYEPKVL